MDIKCGDVGFPYIEIENFYTSEELNLIWEEIEFLYYDHKIERSYGSGEDDDGIPLKTSRCIYLDQFYQDRRSLSNILTVNRKLYHNRERIFKSHSSWFFRECRITRDKTSFSYYENNDQYRPHTDRFYMTCLFWTFKEPKVFDGGRFLFPDYHHEIEVKNNKMLCFPSCITHEVTPVSLKEEYNGKKMGRVCISNFLSCD